MSERIPIKLVLALPSYDGRRRNAIQMITAGQSVARIHYQTAQGSLLAHVFNRLLCEARVRRDADQATHFCMMHDDIEPEVDWLPKLWKEFEERGCQGLISAVSPIKSPHMLTSTALDTDPWNPRKLHLSETARLPKTFTGEDASKLLGISHRGLLVNTGLMLFDLREEWVDDLVFTIRDAIIQKDGSPVAVVEPEDWAMSRFLNARGVPVMATTAVILNHHGGLGWSNQWDDDPPAADAPEGGAP